MKKTNIIKILIIFIIGSFYTHVNSQENKMNPYKVFIKTNRLMFEKDNPITISICIKNISRSKQTLVIFDKEYTTFQPVVYDMQGKEALTKVTYRQAGKMVFDVLRNQKARFVEIAPGETFIHDVNLLDYYSLDLEKQYKVKGFLLVDVRSGALIRSENSIKFKIKAFQIDKRESDEFKIVRQITPAEIIRLFLVAEKDQKKENYIKYIDLKKYINSFSDYAYAYNSASEVYRKKVLKDFVGFLVTPRNDYIVDFEIKDEIINKSSANVFALVTRRGSGVNFTYKYNYTLEKYKDYWLITDVTASVTRKRKND